MAYSAFRRQPKGECRRCGFIYRLNEFKKEWTGQRVCKDCWDPRPADTRPPNYGPEGLPRPDAQPQTDPIYAPPVTVCLDVFDPLVFNPLIFGGEYCTSGWGAGTPIHIGGGPVVVIPGGGGFGGQGGGGGGGPFDEVCVEVFDSEFFDPMIFGGELCTSGTTDTPTITDIFDFNIFDDAIFG